MNILSILIIAVGLAMDSFAVSIAGGVGLKKFRWRNVWATGLVMGIFQAGFFVSGYAAASFISHLMKSWDHWIAFVLLAIVGGHMIVEQWRSEEGQLVDLRRKRILLALGVATSIDALAVGISFSLLDFNIYQAAAIIALVSLVFSGVGVVLGHRVAKIKRFPAHLVGGLFLVAIGVKILVEHLLHDV